MSRLSSGLVRAAYRAGWAIGPRLPERVQRMVMTAGSRLAVRRGGRHLDTLRHNLAVAGGGPVDDDLVRAAVASYLRTFFEVLRLPQWGPDRILAEVGTVGEGPLRAAHAGAGAVVALPHSGNWDLAGAWACLSGMPVTSVAERLPAAEFADFLRFRRQLGMEVLSHDDPRTVGALVDAVRRGRVVCLIADRDLAGAGVPVRWAGRAVAMPAGPALVARRSGGALIPAVCRYTDAGMVITIGPPVTSAPGRAGLLQMTQQVADFFAAEIARQPQDWHMFQPFFPRDAE